MRRIGAVLLIILGLLATGVIVAAQQGFMIRGRIGATDQEAQEGYFAVDNQTMIVVKPGTEIHAYLRSRVGQRVRISIEPETGSD
jgi:hypothetical protein